MKPKIYCLFVKGISMSDAALELLETAARDMAEKGDQTRKVRNDDIFATITTEWESASLVDISGIVFYAAGRQRFLHRPHARPGRHR